MRVLARSGMAQMAMLMFALFCVARQISPATHRNANGLGRIKIAAIARKTNCAKNAVMASACA